MKQLFPLATFCFLFAFANAQAPDWKWITSAGGFNDDQAYTVTSDMDGNIILGGSFSLPYITFGTDTLKSAGSYDFFITKFDPSGNVLWTKRGGGTSSDQISSITTDPLGNIIVLGGFTSYNITFGSLTLQNTGGWDIFLARLGPEGNVQWVKGLKGPGHDNGNCVIADPNSIVIGGSFKDWLIIESDTLTNVSSGTYAIDIFLAKFDTSGNLIWVKSAGGSGEDVIQDLSFDHGGNILAYGEWANPSIQFDTITLSGSKLTDAFLAKYSSTGELLWIRTAGGTTSDFASSVTVDNNDNAIITGTFFSPIMYFGQDSLINTSYASDFFLAKYAPDGNVIWIRNEGTIGLDFGYSLCTGLSNDIYVAGVFSGFPFSIGNDTLVTWKGWDIFLVKYNETGDIEWAKSVGGNDTDDLYSQNLHVTPGGDLLLAGNFISDTLFLDSAQIPQNDPLSFGRDVFLAVMNIGEPVSVIDLGKRGVSQAAIFPNPGTGTFKLESSLPVREIRIFDAGGRLVFMKSGKGERSHTIDIGATGTYFVQIFTEKSAITQKVVIKN